VKFERGKTSCPACKKDMLILVYGDADSRGWTLFSDGYTYFPNDQAPWHKLKLCPHCSHAFELTAQPEITGLADLPSGDGPPPRERIRKMLQAGRMERRELLLMDLWVSNHICGAGRDQLTRAHMEELLAGGLDGLDPVVRADVLRQLGRFQESRRVLAGVVDDGEGQDSNRQIHVRALRSLLSRKEREAFAVLSDGRYVPPTGRLAIHRGAFYDR